MNIRKGLGHFVLIVCALALAACANMAPSVPGTFNGMSSEAMPKIFISSSSGAISTLQYQVVALAAKQSNEQIDIQISSPIESEGVSGAAYGGAYAASGATQPLFYLGALGGAAAGVAGVEGFAGGAVNGASSWSYADVNAVGSATEQTLRDWKTGEVPLPAAVQALLALNPGVTIEKLLAGIHAYPASVRSRNRDNQPADKLVQDWKGPAAGSSAK
jgi:hypothetical protein